MNTKEKSENNLVLILLLIAFTILSCNNSDHDNHPEKQKVLNELTYTCPMHPEVESNQPGKCPKCKMNLELKLNDATDQIISPNKQVLSRQSTVKLTTQSETQSLKAQGYIDLDRNRNQTVSSRFGGRIEKLYVKYDFQFIKKGERILELYSSELNTFQEEHLFILKTKSEESLVEQSRLKLKLLGLTDNQITQLEKNKMFTQSISVFSPSSGYIFFNAKSNNNPDPENAQQSSMNNMTNVAKNNTDKLFDATPNQIREGMYINKGETLFSINDLQNVWAIVSVPAEIHSSILINKRVIIISELFPDKLFNGKMALVEKTFEENKQRFVRLRIDLPNPKGQLKLNSLITAEINLGSKGNFQIPVSAVYRTGFHSFVWVKTGTTESGTGIFKLRKVSTSLPGNGMINVIAGLYENEEVAEHAGYLTDSETFLNDN
jgi:Cu(I)/Ag(I) efflux system membrane fusion protein